MWDYSQEVTLPCHLNSDILNNYYIYDYSHEEKLNYFILLLKLPNYEACFCLLSYSRPKGDELINRTNEFDWLSKAACILIL